MIVRSRFVLTMDGPPIEDGAVAISGGRITGVGTFAEIRGRYSDDITDLGESVLLPGLINAHCHFDYTCLRGQIPPPKSFADWIRAINAAKAKLSPADYVASICDGFAEAKRFGTTTVANLTAFPELIAQITAPIRTWWFSELIDVRAPGLAAEVLERGVEPLQATKYRGLAPHAPFTASTELYRRAQELAAAEHLLLTTHLAESREELSMFRDAAGPLFEFMREIGREMEDCGQGTPLARFLGATGADQSWIIAHLNELTESDFDLLAATKPKFDIVHCPRSHQYFGHSAFPFQRLRELQFNICLGTDSLASNDDLSLFSEMRSFRQIYPDIPSAEILETVTLNPARALQRSHELGRLRPNYLADLIALPCSESGKDLFEQIIASQAASWVMVSGETAKG